MHGTYHGVCGGRSAAHLTILVDSSDQARSSVRDTKRPVRIQIKCELGKYSGNLPKMREFKKRNQSRPERSLSSVLPVIDACPIREGTSIPSLGMYYSIEEDGQKNYKLTPCLSVALPLLYAV